MICSHTLCIAYIWGKTLKNVAVVRCRGCCSLAKKKQQTRNIYFIIFFHVLNKKRAEKDINRLILLAISNFAFFFFFLSLAVRVSHLILVVCCCCYCCCCLYARYQNVYTKSLIVQTHIQVAIYILYDVCSHTIHTYPIHWAASVGECTCWMNHIFLLLLFIYKCLSL